MSVKDFPLVVFFFPTLKGAQSWSLPSDRASAFLTSLPLAAGGLEGVPSPYRTPQGPGAGSPLSSPVYAPCLPTAGKLQLKGPEEERILSADMETGAPYWHVGRKPRWGQAHPAAAHPPQPLGEACPLSLCCPSPEPGRPLVCPSLRHHAHRAVGPPPLSAPPA